MVSYDAQIIVTFAERLYKQADSIAATYAIVGALVGAGIGAAVGNAFGGPAFVGMVIGAVLAMRRLSLVVDQGLLREACKGHLSRVWRLCVAQF